MYNEMKSSKYFGVCFFSLVVPLYQVVCPFLEVMTNWDNKRYIQKY